MPVPLDQAQLSAALSDLGVTAADVQAIRMAPLPRAQELLRELKERARKNYKRWAFELHPDRTGNDPVKTERFKLLGQVLADIEKLQVQAPPPMPVPGPMPRAVPVPVQWVHVGPPTTANASTTTRTTHFGPRFVVIMGPRF